MKIFTFATLCVFVCLVPASLTFNCTNVNPFWDTTLFPNAINLAADAGAGFNETTGVYNLTKGSVADTLCSEVLKGQSCCSPQYLEKSQSTLDDLVKLISDTSKENYESRINKLVEAEKTLGKGVDAMFNVYAKSNSLSMKVITSALKISQDVQKDPNYALSLMQKFAPLAPAFTLLQESMMRFVNPEDAESKTVKFYSERILKNVRACIDVVADVFGLPKSDLHYINNAIPHILGIASTGNNSMGALAEFVYSSNTTLNTSILESLTSFGSRQLLVPIPEEFKPFIPQLEAAYPAYADIIAAMAATGVMPIPALADGKNLDAISLAFYNIVKDCRTISEATIAMNNASAETLVKTINDTGVWERKSFFDIQFGGNQPNTKRLLNKVYAWFFRSVVNTTVQASDNKAKNECLDLVLQYHAFVRCSACRVESGDDLFIGNQTQGLTVFFNSELQHDLHSNCGAYFERLTAANSSIQLIQGINGLGNVTSDADYVLNPNAIYGQQPKTPLDSQNIYPVSLATLLGYNSSDKVLPNSWFTDVLLTPFGMNLSTVLFQENENLIVLKPSDTTPFNQQDDKEFAKISSSVQYRESAPMVSLVSTGFNAHFDYTINRENADALIAAEDPVITLFGWRVGASVMLAFTAVFALLF